MKKTKQAAASRSFAAFIEAMALLPDSRIKELEEVLKGSSEKHVIKAMAFGTMEIVIENCIIAQRKFGSFAGYLEELFEEMAGLFEEVDAE